MSNIDYGSNQGRAYDEYLPDGMEDWAKKYWLGARNDPRTRLEFGEREEPLDLGVTPDEFHQQLPSPWTGLNIALALVLAAAVSGLLLHAAARAGWLS